jgi:hypothetical protein
MDKKENRRMARKKGTRYLKILRGSDQVARDRLIQYFKGEIRPTYPERGGDRPSTVDVWVMPFGLPFTAAARLLQTMSSTGTNELSSYASSFASTTPPAAASRVVRPGLLVPRAAITTGRTQTGTSKSSKITGRPYKTYGGSSVSVPFGEGSGTDEKSENEVFQKIFAAVKTANTKNLCSFVPGSYSLT